MLGYMNTLIKLQDRRDLLENKLVELEGLKKANVKVVDSSGFVAQTVKKTAIRILSALVASFIASLWVIAVVEYIEKRGRRLGVRGPARSIHR